MELTEQQIELAAKTAYGKVNLQEFAPANHPENWNNLSDDKKLRYKRMMVIGAPFLQMPWEDPTSEEVEFYSKSARRGNSINAVKVMCGFVRGRNAALAVISVDSRRAKIYEALAFSEGVSPVMDATVDRIIAALDSKS